MTPEFGNPIYLISDEPYREVVYDGVEVPWLPAYNENTLVCYSYSKCLSLPGERIGYIAINPKMDQLAAVLSSLNVATRILGFVNVGNINYGLRLAYMFVTYVLYEALYTCVNVPFGTLSSVMTDDVSQRTALSRYRSLGGTIFMTVMVISIMTSLNWLIKLETTEARFPSFASITPTNRANTMMGSISPFAMEPIGFFGMMLSSVSTRLTLESAAVEDRSAF